MQPVIASARSKGKPAQDLIRGKSASFLFPSEGWEGKGASFLFPSLDGRGWGRVILERRVLTQKLGLGDNHHNPGLLARDKNNFSTGEKDVQCYW
jgi:hypothetical protein